VFDNRGDAWSLLGFTAQKPDSFVRLIDNCDLLKAESAGRVECQPSAQSNGLVDNNGNSLAHPRTLPLIEHGESGVIPLVVVGLIIVLGMVLLTHYLVTNQRQAPYSHI